MGERAAGAGNSPIRVSENFPEIPPDVSPNNPPDNRVQALVQANLPDNPLNAPKPEQAIDNDVQLMHGGIAEQAKPPVADHAEAEPGAPVGEERLAKPIEQAEVPLVDPAEEQPGSPLAEEQPVLDDEEEEFNEELTLKNTQKDPIKQEKVESIDQQKIHEHFAQTRTGAFVKAADGGYDFEEMQPHNMARMMAQPHALAQMGYLRGLWNIAFNNPEANREIQRDIEQGAPIRGNIDGQRVQLPIPPAKLKFVKFNKKALDSAIKNCRADLKTELQKKSKDEVHYQNKMVSASKTSKPENDPKQAEFYQEKAGKFFALILQNDKIHSDNVKKRKQLEHASEEAQQRKEADIASDIQRFEQNQENVGDETEIHITKKPRVIDHESTVETPTDDQEYKKRKEA